MCILFNYQGIEFCGACFIFICIPQVARRRHYAHYTVVMHSSLTDPQKSLSYFFSVPVNMLCGLESLFTGSININVKLFSLYLCSGLPDCEICQSHINKYIFCAS